VALIPAQPNGFALKKPRRWRGFRFAPRTRERFPAAIFFM
jgi:hypothetical protein